MNANLEKNVEIFSNHYVQRFKFLLEGEMLNLQVKRHKDAYSIQQEYLCMMAKLKTIIINGYM